MKGGNIGDRDGIVILSSAGNACGGTDATLDKSAPTEIRSEDMTFFDVYSALGTEADREFTDGEGRTRRLGYVHGYACPCGEGTFVLLTVSEVTLHSVTPRSSRYR